MHHWCNKWKTIRTTSKYFVLL